MSSKLLNIEILLKTFRLKFGYSKLEHFWINCILEGWNSWTLPSVIFVIATKMTTPSKFWKFTNTIAVGVEIKHELYIYIHIKSRYITNS